MPSLIVFDLDLTLWHCGQVLWCDQLRPPLHKDDEGNVFDSDGVKISLFHNVPEILEHLLENDILLALASRTSAPEIARELLNLFGISSCFAHQEIYPGDKAAHFTSLHEQTGIPYEEMVFFDDEHRNIADVSELGVQTHLVSQGITLDLIKICTV